MYYSEGSVNNFNLGEEDLWGWYYGVVLYTQCEC